MSKSHVSMAAKKCPVCDKVEESGEILLDRRIQDSLDPVTVTGMGLCKEHTKEGFVCLIIVDAAKSTDESVFRTGELVYIKEEAAKEIFNKPIDGWSFAPIEVAEKLKEMTPKE